MRDVHTIYEGIRQGLMAGDEALVEVVELKSGALQIKWGVRGRQTLQITPASARALIGPFRASGWDNVADLLKTAIAFCDNRAREKH